MGNRFAPPTIWLLGCVSFLTACSSAMVYSVLPLFLVKELHASVVYLGLIEGVAESLNSFAKVASGTISDGLKRRKILIVIGYGVSAINKLTFPLARDPLTILLCRVIDRFGKGIRDAPRDALVADIIPQRSRGAGFGFRLSFYTAGYVAGPLSAMWLMRLSGDDFRLVFWAAVLPAFAGVIVASFLVEEKPARGLRDSPRLSFWTLWRLPRSLWFVIGLGAIFSLARIGNSFLVLKAHDIGMSPQQAPVVILTVHFVYACLAYPFGALADRIDRATQLKIGAATLGFSAIFISNVTSGWLMLAGAAMWGLQLAVTQGLFAALIADRAPSHLRGTAFGIHELSIGGATLIANTIAGVLWATFGSVVVYTLCAVFAVLAMIVIWVGFDAEKAGARD